MFVRSSLLQNLRWTVWSSPNYFCALDARRWSVWLGALLLAAATLTACLPRVVVVNGTEMPYDEGAELLLKQGKEALARGDRRTAEARFKEVLRFFDESREVPEALDGLAKIGFEDGGCRASIRFDQQLIANYSDHPAARRAKERQAGCEGVEVAPLASAFTKEYEAAKTEVEKKDVASRAADAALNDGEFMLAVQWLLRVRGHETDPAQRQALETEIIELIDGKMSATGLQMLAKALRGRDFPAARVNAKLALLLEHAGDVEEARSTLERYVQTWPSSEFAPIARERLERLNALTRVSPNTVGVLLPMSGRHKGVGRSALQAIRVALGLRGKSLTTSSGLKLVIGDTKSDGVKAAEAVDSLVIKHGVQAILGPIFTYEAEPAAFRAQALGVPLLTISRDENLPRVGEFVFRNGVTDLDQVQALVAHAMDVKGMRTFAILYPRNAYGENLMNLFWDEVLRRGGEIRGVEAYDVDATTFTGQVKRLVGRQELELRADYRRAVNECEEEKDPYRQARCKSQVAKEIKPLIDFEGLFIPHYPPTLSMISAALAAEDIIVEQDPRRLRVIERTIGRKVTPVTLLGANGWNSAKVLDRSGRNVENAIFTDWFFENADERVTAEFVLEYRKRYQRTPRPYPEALIYDSAKILAQVMAEKPAGREDVRQLLRRVTGFAGVTGQTTFDGTNVATRQIRILTIKDGQIEAVSVAPKPEDAPGAPKTN